MAVVSADHISGARAGADSADLIAEEEA